MNLEQAPKLAKRAAPDVSLWSDAQLREGAEAITGTLAGFGIGQLDRLAVHEERKAIRVEMDRRKGAGGSGSLNEPPPFQITPLHHCMVAPLHCIYLRL